MPCVRFEPTIRASERVKTVYALDSSATVTGDFIVTGQKLEQNIVLRHPVALCIPVLALTSPSLCNLAHMLKFTLRRLFVSSYYLFNTTCFGQTGYHQVYKTVKENWCSVVKLLSYFTLYFRLLCLG
jgi:hypothetical protein